MPEFHPSKWEEPIAVTFEARSRPVVVRIPDFESVPAYVVSDVSCVDSIGAVLAGRASVARRSRFTHVWEAATAACGCHRTLTTCARRFGPSIVRLEGTDEPNDALEERHRDMEHGETSTLDRKNTRKGGEK